MPLGRLIRCQCRLIIDFHGKRFKRIFSEFVIRMMLEQSETTTKCERVEEINFECYIAIEPRMMIFCVREKKKGDYRLCSAGKYNVSKNKKSYQGNLIQKVDRYAMNFVIKHRSITLTLKEYKVNTCTCTYVKSPVVWGKM